MPPCGDSIPAKEAMWWIPRTESGWVGLWCLPLGRTTGTWACLERRRSPGRACLTVRYAMGPFTGERAWPWWEAEIPPSQDALFLSGVCQQVTLVHRREQFRGEYRLVRRLGGAQQCGVSAGLGAGEFSAEGWGFCRAGPGAGPAERNTRCSRWTACLSLWGSSRGTGPFSNQVELNQEGYFAAGEDCRTKLPGVFVAGDSRAKAVRQLTTAVGDGAVAGLAAARYVEDLEG